MNPRKPRREDGDVHPQRTVNPTAFDAYEDPEIHGGLMAPPLWNQACGCGLGGAI